ncbi:hypothetical protein [Streptomyces sp. SCL15-4]|uniref:hypothetical protein n=1 Tax=Streptomyces sp. SCL15-4 TaxID=2967221 RepID=UPI002966B49F|nr:hypothetical protein [Streptomyces sp. SCL15-4]
MGWSYGALGGAPGAHRDPGRALGTTPVDGARPYDRPDKAMEHRVRELFRRLNRAVPPRPPTGPAPRTTAGEAGSAP